MNKRLSTKQPNNLGTDYLPDNVVVSVKNVSKKFCKNLRRSMAYGIADLAKNLVGVKSDSSTLRRDEFWALKDISFKLIKGEALGLIGMNGSGKTTLLRLITGIFPPDKGEIVINGRVGAVIALGAGFHPHMTGWENTYLNGSILGMTRKEINLRINDIIDFSEIGEFINAPVSTYSSGMRVRLGFAIAAYLYPEILLVDEVLAVGDIGFRRKCLNHMRNFINSGGSCVFVSHNLHMVQSFCNRCLLLKNGEVQYIGDTIKAIDHYFKKEPIYVSHSANRAHKLDNNRPVMIENLEVLPLSGDIIYPGDDIRVTLFYHSIKSINGIEWGLSFWTADRSICIASANSADSNMIYSLSKNKGQLTCVIPELNLVPGTYNIKSNIRELQNRLPLARIGFNDAPTYFTVEGLGNDVANRQRIDKSILTIDVRWEN